jgi:hypothetical protein
MLEKPGDDISMCAQVIDWYKTAIEANALHTGGTRTTLLISILVGQYRLTSILSMTPQVKLE